jgi:hypothetical protein
LVCRDEMESHAAIKNAVRLNTLMELERPPTHFEPD